MAFKIRRADYFYATVKDPTNSHEKNTKHEITGLER
jgi:hypothetical protein